MKARTKTGPSCAFVACDLVTSCALVGGCTLKRFGPQGQRRNAVTQEHEKGAKAARPNQAVHTAARRRR